MRLLLFLCNLGSRSLRISGSNFRWINRAYFKSTKSIDIKLTSFSYFHQINFIFLFYHLKLLSASNLRIHQHFWPVQLAFSLSQLSYLSLSTKMYYFLDSSTFSTAVLQLECIAPALFGISNSHHRAHSVNFY